MRRDVRIAELQVDELYWSRVGSVNAVMRGFAAGCIPVCPVKLCAFC